MIEAVTAVSVLSLVLLGAWGALRDRDDRVLAPTRNDRGRWSCSGCGERVELIGPHVAIEIHSDDRMKLEKYHRRCAPGDLGERGDR